MSPLFHLPILVVFVLALMIADLPLSHAQTIDELKAGVVKITATVAGQQRVGTGFIVRIEDKTAYIVTASHVVEGAALTVNFFPNPDKDYAGTTRNMQGGNTKGLAVIKVQGPLPEGIRSLVLASSFEVKGGESATVIGFRRSPSIQWGVLQGILTGQTGGDLIVSGVGANEGNSGGPILVNEKVVGVMTEVLDDIGYAVPASITQIILKGWGVRVEQGISKGEGVVSSDSGKSDGMPDALPKEITGKDGAPMVLVPAGEFTMGSPEGVGEGDEHPQHTVNLKAFYIDQNEVTVERYNRFMTQTNRRQPEYWEEVAMYQDSQNQKPIVGIDWKDALTYCEWAGKRLPTEAEWEKAARGTEGLEYPWGNRFDPAKCNFVDSDVGTKSVLKYKKGVSPFGCFDMAGNVWEWCASGFDQYPNQRVLRGGAWHNLPGTLLRSSNRTGSNTGNRSNNIGFRLAQDTP